MLYNAGVMPMCRHWRTWYCMCCWHRMTTSSRTSSTESTRRRNWRNSTSTCEPRRFVSTVSHEYRSLQDQCVLLLCMYNTVVHWLLCKGVLRYSHARWKLLTAVKMSMSLPFYGSTVFRIFVDAFDFAYCYISPLLNHTGYCVGRCWSVSRDESCSSGRSSWSSMRRCWGRACPTAPPLKCLWVTPSWGNTSGRTSGRGSSNMWAQYCTVCRLIMKTPCRTGSFLLLSLWNEID